jgi:hypothetical protein
MPKHSHSYNARVRGNEDGSNRWTLAEGDTRWTDPSGGMADGKTKPHENMPPFYILCYICYTGVGL